MINRRGRGAIIDRRQPTGVAMGEDVDRFAGLLVRRQTAKDLEAVRADRAVDLDVLVGDSLGLRISGGGARLRGERGEKLADRIQRPAQVDRGRPRRGKLLVRGVERRVARILAHGEREPIGRRRADQRRPAHPHVADRGRRFVDAAQRRDLELMRQPALVDDVDARAVFVEPDRAIRASVNLHESVLLIPASDVLGAAASISRT